MAGIKGMKGGGGARPGAGRKPSPPVIVPTLEKAIISSENEPDSIKFLRQIVNDATIDAKLRLDAAKALAPYEAVRKGEVGKKDERQQAAKKAGSKFAPVQPPLRVVSGR